MKQLAWCFLFLALLATDLNAQGPFHVGVHVSPQSSWLLNRDQFKGTDGIAYRSAFGWSAGLSFGRDLAQAFGVEAGLIYSSQGQQYALDPGRIGDSCLSPHAERLDVALDYLKIPLLFKYHLGSGSTVSSLFAGPQLSLLASADDMYNGLVVCYIGLLEPERRYRKRAVDAVVGIEARHVTSAPVAFRAALKVEYGLRNVFIDEETEGYGHIMYRTMDHFQNSSNLVLGLALGLSYAFP